MSYMHPFNICSDQSLWLIILQDKEFLRKEMSDYMLPPIGEKMYNLFIDNRLDDFICTNEEEIKWAQFFFRVRTHLIDVYCSSYKGHNARVYVATHCRKNG